MKYEINQYQDIFFVNKKCILVDYLYGTMDIQNILENDNTVIQKYSQQYEELEKKYSENKNLLISEEMTVVLIPSYSCNMECEYCYEGHQKLQSSLLSVEDGDSILKFLKQNQYKKINFILLGGEPIFRENLFF